MKKKLLLGCLLILTFVLTACNKEAETSTETNTTEQASLQTATIGETFTSELVDFNLETCEFGDNLNSFLEDEDFLQPTTDSTALIHAQKPEEGNIFLSYSFNIKNNGKNDIDMRRSLIQIDYNNGYTYEATLNEYYALTDGKWEWRLSSNSVLTPLSTRKYRGYFEVPLEVFENTDKPLKLNVQIYVKEGNTFNKATTLTYTIR